MVDLKSERHRFGLTQEQLAEKTGLSRAYIAQVEIGKFTPTPKKAMILAEALGFDWCKFYED